MESVAALQEGCEGSIALSFDCETILVRRGFKKYNSLEVAIVAKALNPKALKYESLEVRLRHHQWGQTRRPQRYRRQNTKTLKP